MADDARLPAATFDYCPSPVFVIGAPRSGTTALAHALARHSAFYAGDESFFLWDLFADGRAEDSYRRWALRPSSSWFHRERVSEESFLASLGLGLNAMFTVGSDGRRWVDHTPVHALMAETLGAMFPGAKFLHILRDGREVVNSMIHIQKTLTGNELEQMTQAEFMPDWARDFRLACETWRSHVRAASDFGRRHPDRCHTVLHRDFERNPAIAMAAILQFLDERYEEKPTRFLTRHRLNSSFTPPDGAAVRDSIRPDPRATWSAEQRATFADIAGADMIQLGLAVSAELDAAAGSAPMEDPAP